MDIFFTLLSNIFPLYIFIALGWIAGRFFGVGQKSLGALGIYIFMPIMAFGFLAELEFQVEYIVLPFVFYVIRGGLTLAWLRLGRAVYPDKRANLLAICTSSGNTAYFGIPVALLLFPADIVGLYVFVSMGSTMCELTITYYVAARGRFSVRDSLIKLAKFPTLYAVLACLLYNYFGFEMNALADTYWEYVKGAYIVVGMMLIGVALSQVKRLVLPLRFVSLSFLGKFVVFPLVTFAVIWADKLMFQMFDTQIYMIFYLMSIVPIAANVAAFAVEMDLAPEKAASTILVSTVFALVSIPLMLVLFDWVMM